jgi:hypothetical protein
MKKLNIISKIIVMLFVVLQVNSTSAKTSNNSNIEELAKKIVKSESGLNFMAIQSVNAISFIGSISRMTENERLITKQKFENFENLTNQEFTSSLKEEFARLRGFYDYDSFQNFKSMSNTSLQVLLSDFPEINTISSSDRVLLFETIAEKFDYSSFSSPEFAAMAGITKCITDALALYGACMIPGAGSAVIARFVGCMVVSEVVETVATDGAAQADAPAVVAVDAKICGWLFGLTLTNVGVCTTNFMTRLDKC